MTLRNYHAVRGGLEALLEGVGGDAAWRVGTPVKYAVYVHEGTERMPGRPYFTDAIDSTIRRHGDQLAAQADSVDEFLEAFMYVLQGEIKRKIREYDAVDTGRLHDSIEVVKVA